MMQLMRVRKAAAAILPIDGFTGQPVRGDGVRVRMEDGGSFVKKDNGIVVFWDNGSRERRLLVDSPYFSREEVRLNMERLEQKWQPTYSVWLRPTGSYPYPPAIRLKQGTADPGTLIRHPQELTAGLIRLLPPVPDQGTHCIRLDVPEPLHMEGRTLFLRSRANPRSEYVTIWEERSRSMGIYELEMPPAGEFNAADTEILLVSETFADKKGQYRIPEMQQTRSKGGTDEGIYQKGPVCPGGCSNPGSVAGTPSVRL